MALNSTVMRAVEHLGYRVTVGDVASQAGLDIKLAERDLLALASESGGHMQVAESGEIAYLFPRNFRGVLRNKFWRLRLQEWWSRIWRVLFYLIRISFGILLVVSIVIVIVAILVIITAMNSSRDSNGGGRGVDMPRLWFDPTILWWMFTPNYYDQGTYHRRQPRSRSSNRSNQEMNFLEAVFSFLFGDGNPNADLEERRWQTIATVIRNNGGAVAAEQVVPYLDITGKSGQDEDYMLPVLTRFNGQPEVSPDGQIIYRFPELQVTAAEHRSQPVSAYLKESAWSFSRASSGQITLAAMLGGGYLVGSLVLGKLLWSPSVIARLPELVALFTATGFYWVLVGYAIGFVVIPLVRYFWVQWRNQRIEARNQQRQEWAIALNQADPELQQKITFARQFAAETVVSETDLAYTTEKELTEQELSQQDKIDAEWRRRLEQSGS
jgi:flagellar basal body-associated protein FliL